MKIENVFFNDVNGVTHVVNIHQAEDGDVDSSHVILHIHEDLGYKLMNEFKRFDSINQYFKEYGIAEYIEEGYNYEVLLSYLSDIGSFRKKSYSHLKFDYYVTPLIDHIFSKTCELLDVYNKEETDLILGDISIEGEGDSKDIIVVSLRSYSVYSECNPIIKIPVSDLDDVFRDELRYVTKDERYLYLPRLSESNLEILRSDNNYYDIMSYLHYSRRVYLDDENLSRF